MSYLLAGLGGVMMGYSLWPLARGEELSERQLWVAFTGLLFSTIGVGFCP